MRPRYPSGMRRLATTTAFAPEDTLPPSLELWRDGFDLAEVGLSSARLFGLPTSKGNQPQRLRLDAVIIHHSTSN